MDYLNDLARSPAAAAAAQRARHCSITGAGIGRPSVSMRERHGPSTAPTPSAPAAMRVMDPARLRARELRRDCRPVAGHRRGLSADRPLGACSHDGTTVDALRRDCAECSVAPRRLSGAVLSHPRRKNCSPTRWGAAWNTTICPTLSRQIAAARHRQDNYKLLVAWSLASIDSVAVPDEGEKSGRQCGAQADLGDPSRADLRCAPSERCLWQTHPQPNSQEIIVMFYH